MDSKRLMLPTRHFLAMSTAAWAYSRVFAMVWSPTVRSPVKVLKHDDVTKWKYFPRYWPFVRGIHRSPVNSPHKGQWCETLMFSLVCAWINGWVNDREAGNLRRHRGHDDVTVMIPTILVPCHVDKSQQLSWRLDTSRRNLLVAERHNEWQWLGLKTGYQDASNGRPIIVPPWTQKNDFTNSPHLRNTN